MNLLVKICWLLTQGAKVNQDKEKEDLVFLVREGDVLLIRMAYFAQFAIFLFLIVHGSNKKLRFLRPES